VAVKVWRYCRRCFRHIKASEQTKMIPIGNTKHRVVVCLACFDEHRAEKNETE